MVKFDEKNKCYFIDGKIKKRDGSYYHYTYRDNNNPLMKKKKYVQGLEFEVQEQKKRELEYKRNGLTTGTIKDLCDSYIESKENELAQNTIRAYEGIFNSDFPLVFDVNNSVVDEFTPIKAQLYRNKVASQQVSSDRKNLKLYALSEIILLARKVKLIDSETKDDCLFNLEKFKSDIRKKEEHNKYTPLSNLEKILNNTKCQNDRDMLQLLYFSGLRIGEFLGIRVKDLEFKEEMVIVHIEGQRLDNGTYTTRLKNNSSYKQIYYVKENLEVVKNFIERNKLEDNDFFMPYSRTNIRRILAGACKKANVDSNTLHGFGRKSINTELYFATGGDVKVCQTVLGQASSAVNLDHYVSKEEATRKAIETIKDLSF